MLISATKAALSLSALLILAVGGLQGAPLAVTGQACGEIRTRGEASRTTSLPGN